MCCLRCRSGLSKGAERMIDKVKLQKILASYPKREYATRADFLKSRCYFIAHRTSGEGRLKKRGWMIHNQLGGVAENHLWTLKKDALAIMKMMRRGEEIEK